MNCKLVLLGSICGLAVFFVTWMHPATALVAQTEPAIAAPGAQSLPASPTSSEPLPMTGQPAPTSTAAGIDPEIVLASAVSALEGHGWISARLRHTTELFGQRVQGEGLYQQGPNLRMRYELRTLWSENRPPATLLQVCDGQALWEFRDVEGSRALQKARCEPILAALRDKGQAAIPIPVGQGFIGLGGLSQLLRSVATDFTFEPAAAAQPEVLRLVGAWKYAALARIAPDQFPLKSGSETVQPDKLPEHVPHYVEVVLGAENMFPYRFRYFRNTPQGAQVLLTIEFFDVVFEEPIAEQNFIYQPGPNLIAIDITHEYLQRIAAGK